MIRLLFIVLLFIPIDVYADNWSHEDTMIQILYSAYHIGDWNQTLQITESEDYEETNKILGRNPSDDQVNLYFASTLLAHYYIAQRLSQPYRAYWQSFWISVEHDYLRRNTRHGFKVNIKF